MIGAPTGVPSRPAFADQADLETAVVHQVRAGGLASPELGLDHTRIVTDARAGEVAPDRVGIVAHVHSDDGIVRHVLTQVPENDGGIDDGHEAVDSQSQAARVLDRWSQGIRNRA